MKKYKDFNDLMQGLENIVKKYVRYYKTDFYNYDIATLNKRYASNDIIDKKLTFIARDCGTWLICTSDIKNPDSAAHTIYNYYLPGGPDNPKDHPNKYYNIDLLALTISPLKFDEKGKLITRTKTKAAKKAA